jgi:beta-glucanase (GH16 family)
MVRNLDPGQRTKKIRKSITIKATRTRHTVKNFASESINCALVLAAMSFLIASCAGPKPATATAPAHSWVLVWSDEFNGDTIDLSKWEHSFDCTDHGNNEAQCYTDRKQNSFVDSDGILHLVAKEESFSGPAHAVDHPEHDINDTSVTKSYTSARLRTRNQFDFKYGRVVVRARLPGGQGMWPAIWMLSTDEKYGGWPSSGEIDIMEAVSLDTAGAANEIHGSMNYGMKWPQWSAHGKSFVSPRSFTREFHDFMIEWEADEIRWFVDGVHYATQTSAGWFNYIWGNQQTGFSVANPRAPYDQKFYLLLNLAVGGHWPGQPDKDWPEDREFLVDYVRVFQCGSGNSDGTGCASAPDALVDTSIEVIPDAGAPRVNRFPVFEDGPETLTFRVGDETIANTLVINSWMKTPGNVVIDVPDFGGGHGKVLDVRFSGPGNIFFSSADMSDFEAFANGFRLEGGTAWSNHGTLEFDLLVESIDAGTTLVAKLDSGYPDLGQYVIETPPIGEWARVAIRISDLLANPLEGGKGIDLGDIANLIVIEATGSSTANIRLDNISLSCAVNEFSKAWQWDTECSIGPVLATN